MESNYKQIRKTFLIRWIAGSLLIAAVMVFFYVNSHQNTWRFHKNELLNLAKITATQIDGDKHATLKAAPEDEATETYAAVRKQLQDIRKAVDDIKFLYTMVCMKDSTGKEVWKFVVDAEDNPTEMSHSGDVYDITDFPQMREAYERPVVDDAIGEDQWGPFLSAYAPVKNRQGHVVAIVGVDRKGALIRSELNHLTFAALTIGVLFVVTFSFTVFFHYRNRRDQMLKEEIRIKNEHIQKLECLLPICCICKNIRDDEGSEKGKGTWLALEEYIHDSFDTNVTHTICPKCKKEHYGEIVTE
jgi:hypothetical protein